MLTAEARALALGSAVKREASRSIKLLETIEATNDSLAIDSGYFDTLTRQLAVAHPEIAKKSDEMIDPTGEVLKVFDRAAELIEGFHALLCRKLESAKRSPDLLPEDGVVESYLRAIEAVAACHNEVMDLAWQIREHDADLDETVGGAYADVDKLFKDMGL